MDESEIPTYQILKQAHFDQEFRLAVPDQERLLEIERGLRFVLRHFPESGKDTGRRSPVIVYTWNIRGTERNPPLIFFYIFGNGKVILMGVKATIDPDDE
jgi:hypothetical protein